jgi:hypothetical protein
MSLLNRWRPGKLEQDGAQHVSAAHNLLETQGANLSLENRNVAQSLLEE